MEVELEVMIRGDRSGVCIFIIGKVDLLCWFYLLFYQLAIPELGGSVGELFSEGVTC